MSLRYRIAATIFVLEALLMSLVLWRTFELFQADYQEQIEATEALLLQLIAEHCRPGLVTVEYAEIQSYIDQVEAPRIRAILLADPRNRVVAASEPSWIGSDLPDLPDEGLEHWRSLEIRNAAGPAGTLAIRFSDHVAHESSQRILKSVLILTGIGMTIIAGIALLMGHLLTRRLVALGKAVQRLSSGDFTAQADLRGGDEVTQVGVAFDEMARNLQESISILQEKEAQMRLLTDALPVGIAYLDSERKVSFSNLQMSKWFDWNREQITDRPLQEIARVEHFEALLEGLEAALRGNIVHHERNLHLPRKETVMDVVNVPDIGSDGAVRGVYLLLRDITHIKRREIEKERLMAELAAKNSELEQFAYSVSHDLKSPLITILGSVEYLDSAESSKDERSTDSARAKEDLNRIQHAAETMDRMLDELLELARLGVIESKKERVCLNELAQDTTRLLAGRIASRQAEVTISDGMPKVLGDRQRLQRVFQNLVDNGVKFTDENQAPKIEIGARFVDAAQREVLCWVRDQGTGISDDLVDKVFDLFRQADRKKEGTGVGLAIAQRIVEGHGGRIWVESEGIGHGSTFFLTLPAAGRHVFPRSDAGRSPSDGSAI